MTKGLKVVVSAKTINDIVHASCGSGIMCLMNSTAAMAYTSAMVSVPNLTPSHFAEQTLSAYLVPRNQLVDDGTTLHESIFDQMSYLEGFWYQDMMNIGAIHLPASVESVKSISLSYRSLLYREPLVTYSGMQRIAGELRKRFLAATPIKIVVRVNGGQDWPTEVYRCEPSLREYIEQHDDFLRYAN
jgi:hypothetical protein